MTKQEIIKLYINDLFAFVEESHARNAKIDKLKEEWEKEREETKINLLEAYKDLLVEARYLYSYSPENNITPEEKYFHEEFNVVKEMEKKL